MSDVRGRMSEVGGRRSQRLACLAVQRKPLPACALRDCCPGELDHVAGQVVAQMSRGLAISRLQRVTWVLEISAEKFFCPATLLDKTVKGGGWHYQIGNALRGVPRIRNATEGVPYRAKIRTANCGTLDELPKQN
jgi:hypothetical protein